MSLYLYLHVWNYLICMSLTVAMCIVWWYCGIWIGSIWEGVVFGCPGNFGMCVSCSMFIIVLSILIFITGNMEGNSVLGLSTYFYLFCCLLIYWRCVIYSYWPLVYYQYGEIFREIYCLYVLWYSVGEYLFVEIYYYRLRSFLVCNITWEGMKGVLYYYSVYDLIRTSRIGNGYSFSKKYSNYCSELIEVFLGSCYVVEYVCVSLWSYFWL